MSWIKKYAAGWCAPHLIGLQMELREASGYKYVWLIFVLFSLADCENMGSRLIDIVIHAWNLFLDEATYEIECEETYKFLHLLEN
jgi:hypothetical protein